MACYLWFQGVNSLLSVIDSAFHWSNIIFSQSEFVFADDCTDNEIYSILLLTIKTKHLLNVLIFFNDQAELKKIAYYIRWRKYIVEENSVLYTQTGIRAI